MDALVGQRNADGKFTSLTHFLNRMESKDVNKRYIESLIKAGAFDSLGGKRAQYMTVYFHILNGVSQTKKNNIAGQLNLFEMDGNNTQDIYRDELPRLNEYDLREMLEYEKEVLGIYLSGHPLEEYMNLLADRITANSLDFLMADDEADLNVRLPDGKSVTVGGIITGKSVKYTRGGKMMAFLTIEDMYGTMEVIVFPNTYEKMTAKLAVDAVILVEGKVTAREDEDAKLISDKITICDELKPKKKTPKDELWLKAAKGIDSVKPQILDIISLYPGETPVIIYDETKKQKHTLTDKFFVDSDPLLIDQLKEILGNACVALKHTGGV